MPVNMDILRDFFANPEMDINVISMAVDFLTTEEQNEILENLTDEEKSDPSWGRIITSIAEPQIREANEEFARLEATADRLASFADMFRRPGPLTPQEEGDAVDLAQGIERVNEEAGFDPSNPGPHGDPGDDDDERRREEEEEEKEEREEEEEKEAEEEREREQEERDQEHGH